MKDKRTSKREKEGPGVLPPQEPNFQPASTACAVRQKKGSRASKTTNRSEESNRAPEPGAYAVTGIGVSNDHVPPSDDLEQEIDVEQAPQATPISAVAAPVNGSSNDEKEAQIAKAAPVTKSEDLMHNRWIHLLCCLVVLVVAAGVIVYFILVKGGNKVTPNSPEGALSGESTATGKEVSPTAAPTSAPKTRSDLLYDLVSLYSTEEDLTNQNSSQSRALSWLTYGDPFEFSITEAQLLQHQNDTISTFENNNSVVAIVQRYVMAVFMYSIRLTTFENKNETECYWNGNPKVIEEVTVSEEEENDDFLPPVASFRRPLLMINCNKEGRISRIVIPRLSCDDLLQLPSELSHLKYLNTFQAHMVGCQSHQFSAMSGVKSLTDLSLSLEKPLVALSLRQLPSKFVTTIPKSFANLTNLKRLSIRSSSVWLRGAFTGTIPSDLGQLYHLTTMDFMNNQLTGSIPSELGNLESLTELNLAPNNLNGTVPVELVNLRALARLDLSDNKNLGGMLPSEVLLLPNIDLGNVNLRNTNVRIELPPKPDVIACRATSILLKTECDPSTQIKLQLTIVTDNNPKETSWMLTTSSRRFIDGTEPGDLCSGNTLYTQELCLSRKDCFDFSLLDVGGNGMCCSQGVGSYSLVVDGKKVVSGGEFPSGEATRFGNCAFAAELPESEPIFESEPFPRPEPESEPFPEPGPLLESLPESMPESFPEAFPETLPQHSFSEPTQEPPSVP